MTAPYDTNSPDLVSWVESANASETPFPIQNLPYGRFRRDASDPWSIGVAIGDQVLDVHGAGLFHSSDMVHWLTLGRGQRQAQREAISMALQHGGEDRARVAQWLVPMSMVELGLPCDVRNYSDFFIGIHHAYNTGRLYRPDTPLLPNYRWVPIGYHGRASSIQVSGRDFVRPKGQVKPAGEEAPSMRSSDRLDFELEMGIVIGRGNAQGDAIPIDEAEDHIAGLTLLNDWSARDLQAWEAQPLGPFLAKSFATTLSPWIVTLEALAPFRKPFIRSPDEPQPLPYLEAQTSRELGAIDATLEVWLQTPQMRAQGQSGECIVRTGLAQAAYWTVAQLVTHHTINGCNLMPGDLLGTGTLSGDGLGQAACLLEITQGGRQPLRLSNGEERLFLHDDDTVTLRGYCERPGHRRIGFGDCTATVRKAKPSRP
ncbi:fumarylacetoacetase [Variovorax boronicumulans]|uniref:fumarylacetoacetase n=1 Tax=Variovorax boronicumulans TaxID=436515 RepID=A0AAW8D382_9BURK|nr:fumarylacetoacetase [Variovorax boronicumulans]MDP9894959.1 fumarylacetoacetase [Variovorax boronicumulans]MDQ0054721.1 fumarylacetoacetase [Variovorax boronicumulans]